VRKAKFIEVVDVGEAEDHGSSKDEGCEGSFGKQEQRHRS
jgi:hypothetical protein